MTLAANWYSGIRTIASIIPRAPIKPELGAHFNVSPAENLILTDKFQN